MHRSTDKSFLSKLINFFTGGNITYVPDPQQLGYTQVKDSTFILFIARIGQLSFLMLFLIPLVSVHKPFGYTIPIDDTTLFLCGIVLFFVISKAGTLIRSSKRVCPECGGSMEFYPMVERSTYKYICHGCKTYIDTHMPNYSDP